jgi:hypothetical protein
MNPLMGIPAKVRLWLYVAYGAAGLVISSVATYCTAVGTPVPRWSVGSAAVLASVGVAFGATAASNVTRDPKPAVKDAPAPADPAPAVSEPAAPEAPAAPPAA